MTIDLSSKHPIHTWTDGVPVEPDAMQQLRNVANLPIIHDHIAVMPDVHYGIGATVGSVIPTIGAVIPAAVGVDIGCGMCAVRTSLVADDLPDRLSDVRAAIEDNVPVGRSGSGLGSDRGGWQLNPPKRVINLWRSHCASGLDAIIERHPKIGRSGDSHKRGVNHLGSLGSGNHFIEICLDEAGRVWVMLHSGSRGIGNRIGRYFIEQAQTDMRRHIANLPHKDLAYFSAGSEHFDDYITAVGWAQDYAALNRKVMLERILDALKRHPKVPRFTTDKEAVNCHHNYVAQEHHFGRDCFVTRKGAVRAGVGELGIIPGSMGAKSYIVRGKGQPDSFCSCSHGAGRSMSRAKAKRTFSLDDHLQATAGVECRKDHGVIDETPGAYKDIDAVMAAQSALVDVVHTLKQIVCVKG